MKRLLLFLFVLVASCGTTLTPIVKSDAYQYSEEQFDSMCVAENLTQDLDEWIPSYVKGYETNKVYIRYSITRGDSVTYKVDKINGIYFFKKLNLK